MSEPEERREHPPEPAKAPTRDELSGAYGKAAALLQSAASELAKVEKNEVAGLYLAEVDDILHRLRGEIDAPARG